MRLPKRLPGAENAEGFERLLRRVALYSAAAAVIFIGTRAYVRLEAAAASMPERPAAPALFEGELEGSAFRDALIESGSPEDEAKAIVRALRRFGGTGRRYRGDGYRIERSTAGAFLHATLSRGRKRIVVVPEADGFRAREEDAPVARVERSARGRIQGSLWLSMDRQDAPPEVIQEFADVFQWTVDFLTEPRDGDRWSVVWNEERTPDGRVWGREIVAALYDGKQTDRRVGILYDGRYFDARGESMERMFLRAPLNFRRISSRFSTGRYHPVLRTNRPHHGTDYAAARGTPVVSVGSGRVTAVGRKGGFGKRVEIRHTPVYETLYGHLHAYARGLKVGDRVRQGEVIGYVGSTGLATGPHLHFQISKHGRWVDFLRLKLPKVRAVTPSRKEDYQRVLEARLAALGPEPRAGAETAR